MAERENTRLLALEVLVDAEKKNSFVKDALHKLLFQKQFLSKQDRAFITRLVEGVTEQQVRLDYIINQVSGTPVNKCKPVIRCILRMAVYQIFYMDAIPSSAACDEAVKLAKKKGFRNLTGLVNGVLRNVERNKDNLVFPSKEKDRKLYYSVTYSMPVWLVECMLSWYGEEQTETILKSSIEEDDLTIRVNGLKIAKDDLRTKLSKQGITVLDGCYVEEALRLQNINYVGRTPGFRQGEFFVQDESSMLLYHIAAPDKELEQLSQSGVATPHLQLLDLCAAPGGKCTHFAQMLGDSARIEARDLSEKKVDLIKENIERLGLDNIETVVWDALVPDREKSEFADIVIADLPCSGLGIASKKNDIKYHLSKEQLLDLANLQRTILTNAASYVKPGGILLYSTCTINPEENVENARWFLEHFDFEAEDITEHVPQKLQGSMIDKNMLQLLPGLVECDGFFIAKFRKCRVVE
ncbi:MAG: 16S rRNA (cytosine(967)-C(5))-methyltransferase RsmB [Lachnospiraceae bacterium]|nr:16S rRNA (cytosine(967)-C(5))-methyltransferase RsmB [Lachnospiraceae bacterium]